MNTITLGVDLAKSVFSVCEMDGAGHVLGRQELRRAAFSMWLAQRPPGTVVAMEACSGAHRWARRCLEYGLQPRVMAVHLVTSYRKSRRSKNDRNDAEAMATAARQGTHLCPSCQASSSESAHQVTCDQAGRWLGRGSNRWYYRAWTSGKTGAVCHPGTIRSRIASLILMRSREPNSRTS